jgi:hypothetical protein
MTETTTTAGQRVDPETVQRLAYRLYDALGTSWYDRSSVARRAESTIAAPQTGFDFDALEQE